MLLFLWAEPGAVYRLILGEPAWLTARGIVLGLGGSLGVGVLMRGVALRRQFLGIPTLAAAAGVLGVAALLASYIPAPRRLGQPGGCPARRVALPSLRLAVAYALACEPAGRQVFFDPVTDPPAHSNSPRRLSKSRRQHRPQRASPARRAHARCGPRRGCPR